jgi:ABC-type Fe3+/spermidine/putrescine transport system ATPase subunit
MSNLDAQLREHMRLELKMLQRRLGFTAIFVTHDRAEAFAIADEVVVMNHGRVEMSGPPRRVARAPQSAFVARFLGFNVVPGIVDDRSVSQADAAFTGREPIYVDVRCDAGPLLRGAVAADRIPKQGERVFVCIRREHISARKVEAPSTERFPEPAQIFPGKVKAATFLGFQQEYLLGIGSLQLRAVQLDMGLEAGDEVEVHIQPQSCIVLPDRVASRDGQPADKFENCR